MQNVETYVKPLRFSSAFVLVRLVKYNRKLISKHNNVWSIVLYIIMICLLLPVFYIMKTVVNGVST